MLEPMRYRSFFFLLAVVPVTFSKNTINIHYIYLWVVPVPNLRSQLFFFFRSGGPASTQQMPLAKIEIPTACARHVDS